MKWNSAMPPSVCICLECITLFGINKYRIMYERMHDVDYQGLTNQVKGVFTCMPASCACKIQFHDMCGVCVCGVFLFLYIYFLMEYYLNSVHTANCRTTLFAFSGYTVSQN